MVGVVSPGSSAALLVSHSPINTLRGIGNRFKGQGDIALVFDTPILAIFAHAKRHLSLALFLGGRDPHREHLDVLQTATPPSSGVDGCGLATRRFL